MRCGVATFLAFALCHSFAAGQTGAPLHQRIDALVAAKPAGRPFSPAADDAEFVRRVYLDFAGRIPTAAEARGFLAEESPDRREKLIDRLLGGPEYAARMAEVFHVVLMERLGEHPAWGDYLRQSFEKNKPWDVLVREMLAAAADGEAKGAAFFLSKRLEHYGENPVDYPGLTRDLGRLFLGRDLQCAQCHDHLFVADYKQQDFQGLFAFVQNVALRQGDVPAVLEKPTTAKVEFSSVFGGETMRTGPRVPGLDEVAIPALKKGEEYAVPPDPKKKTPGVLKFSTLEKLAGALPTPGNGSFNRNIVNRLWFLLMGRGLVHPLDLHHSANPPSHPELLDLLAEEFVAHKYDIRWLLRELALTQTYQRSSRLPEGAGQVEPESFRTAIERRLSAEQLLRSLLTATGEGAVKGGATFDSMKAKFQQAFANQAREPEEEFLPTLKAALFLLNDKSVLSWLEPKPGNLLDRVARMDDGPAVGELYINILSRTPSAEEREAVMAYLAAGRDRRPAALRNVAWGLLASTEFCVNH